MALDLRCSLCKKRGKTWNGADPQCAFESGIFDSNNWNCATMNAIRDLADELGTSQRYNDSSAALIPFNEAEFIVCGWYKNRGRTDYAAILFDTEMRPLSLKEAGQLLKAASSMEGIEGATQK